MISESSDTRSRARSGRTLQDGLLRNDLSSSLKQVEFSKQKFPAGTPISNIKYDYFHNQLEFELAHYFVESETKKGKVDKFLSNTLMTPFIKKLSYQNADKWMEKLLEIL